MRGKLSFIFILLAAIAGGIYIVQQSVPETRDRTAAHVTRPIPALFMAIMCVSTCASMRIKPKSKSINHVEYERRAFCQVDVWSVLFGVAFLALGLGDVLQLVHGYGVAAGIVACEWAGQLLMAVAMCLPREVTERRPQISQKVTIIYALAGALLWLLTFFVSCGASKTSAALAATHALLTAAVAWRSTDVMVATRKGVGSVLVFVGAHLAVASAVITSSQTLCDAFGGGNDLEAYYPLAMGTYYAAVILEARGVTKYAIKSDYVASESEDFKA
jgi:hypothetical protein